MSKSSKLFKDTWEIPPGPSATCFFTEENHGNSPKKLRKAVVATRTWRSACTSDAREDDDITAPADGL